MDTEIHRRRQPKLQSSIQPGRHHRLSRRCRNGATRGSKCGSAEEPRFGATRSALVRHRLADLFLDTLPYNAHTTASDALWVGLPLVTCVGDTFAGRVAGSLLRAVGLPELATHSREEYEVLALRLALDPPLLTGLRARLAHNRLTCPLFDTARFARNLEAAYRRMQQCRVDGLMPAAFAVAETMPPPRQ